MAGIVDRLDGECPRCGEAVTDAHARGREVVLVPCGHAVAALPGLEVPPEERGEDE